MESKRRIKGSISKRISVLFLISGVFSLTFSIYSSSQILVLIGLGLTFWGALFVFLSPRNLVEGALLYNTSLSTYMTIDRIIADFGYKGKGYCIPPYPQDVYLPEYLKGLKSFVVFVSATNNPEMPSIEEIAKGRFMSKTQKGVLVVPPGSGILAQIEDRTKVDFAKMDLNELCAELPTFIIQELGLARDLTMKMDGDKIRLIMFDSLYKELYSLKNNLKSVAFLGCPIVSAVACAIAKTSGRTVAIQKQQVSPDGSTIQVWYSIVEG